MVPVILEPEPPVLDVGIKSSPVSFLHRLRSIVRRRSEHNIMAKAVSVSDVSGISMRQSYASIRRSRRSTRPLCLTQYRVSDTGSVHVNPQGDVQFDDIDLNDDNLSVKVEDNVEVIKTGIYYILGGINVYHSLAPGPLPRHLSPLLVRGRTYSRGERE